MSRTLRLFVAVTLAGSFFLCPGCPGPNFTFPPVETGILVTNRSRQFYATVGVREHRSLVIDGDFCAPPLVAQDTFCHTPLLAPGAAFRNDFLNAIGNGCPAFIDLRLLLYRRIHEDVPIGLDPGEEVEQTPIVAGELLNVPYCVITAAVDYTIVNWEAPAGTARVKLVQGIQEFDDCYRAMGDYARNIECIRASQLFPNVDAAWELEDVDPRLAEVAPPSLAAAVPIAGRVTLDDGMPVSGVGVLLRSAFRVRLGSPTECLLSPADEIVEDPDAGYGDPIDISTTDPNGDFAFNQKDEAGNDMMDEDGNVLPARPPGAYQVEFFSDEYTFRPAVICIEAPISDIRTIAEKCNGPCTDN